MKAVNKILIIVFLPVFLFSSTGLVIIHHTCETCGVSEILINKQHKHKVEKCVKVEKKCCKASSCQMQKSEPEKTECCSEDHFYYKVKEPFLSGSNTTDIEIKELQLIDYTPFIELEQEFFSQIYTTSIIKPPDNFGREILRNLCVLRA